VAISEQARHALYEAFKASHGNEVANTLMELLPPVGWADVTTKHDLAGLEERMELRFQLVDARMGERLGQQMVRFWLALIAVAGLSVAVNQALNQIT